MKSKKVNQYERLHSQLQPLLEAVDNPIARMATICALLHHKLNYFYWTGFYLLHNGQLEVGPYQGTLACMRLKKDTGVCWAGINQNKTILVPDVELFPGHIACSSLSKSEIVIPLRDKHGRVVGVLDVDSKLLNAFDQEDLIGLEKIVELIYK